MNNQFNEAEKIVKVALSEVEHTENLDRTALSPAPLPESKLIRLNECYNHLNKITCALKVKFVHLTKDVPHNLDRPGFNTAFPQHSASVGIAEFKAVNSKTKLIQTIDFISIGRELGYLHPVFLVAVGQGLFAYQLDQRKQKSNNIFDLNAATSLLADQCSIIKANDLANGLNYEGQQDSLALNDQKK